MAAPPSPERRVLAATVPAALALAALAVGGGIEAGPAAALAAALAVGVAWALRRRHPAAVAASADEAEGERGLPAHVLDELPDAVVLLDTARQIVAVNKAARGVLGIGGTGRDLSRSLRHPAVLAAVETVTAGVPSISEEITLPVPVPRTFTLYAGRLPGPDEPGAPRVVLVLHDETRAKRAEQSRADFVANASHELRSPLSALIGFIETLQGHAREDAEAREHFLHVMHSEASRMSRLINDLLSLSRVEINEHVPPRDGVDVAAVLDGVADALAVRADAKGMAIVVECPDDLPAVVGDADQLTQVFQNLVDNAVKYGRRRSAITIRARPVERLPGSDAPGVAVSVADRGEGIAPEHLPRVTERFYRVDEGRSRRLGGTGLGLAIVKHIVNRHRGQLQVESEKGVGSTVTVSLPSSTEASAAERAAAVIKR